MSIREVIRMSYELWPNSEYNRKAWIKAVQWLGDRWLLVNPVKRLTPRDAAE